jgi:FKBP-type peptidyl-prolyl cis-trans isomerase FklB
MGKLIFVFFMVGLLASFSLASEPVKVKDEKGRTSYSLGYQMGQDLKRQGVEFDDLAVLRGLKDGQAGVAPLLSQEEINAVLAELKRRMVQDLADERQAKTVALKQAGIDFLAANKTKPGIKTTTSGLQYKVITPGSGKQPGLADTVRVHYRAKTVEGRQFDSTYKRGAPRDFTVNRVIKGWGEGLQLMQEGAKYELYIPWTLAYGTRGPLAYKALIFEVELLAVNPGDSEQAGTDSNQN